MTTVRFVYADLSALALPKVRQRLRGFVEASAILLADEIGAVINEGKPGGRWYRIPGTKRRYRASAPGQVPAEREAIYARSYRASPAVQSSNEVTAYVTSDRKVGRYQQHPLGLLLEEGTQDGRIKARPHIAKALRRVRPKIRQLAKAVQELSG